MKPYIAILITIYKLANIALALNLEGTDNKHYCNPHVTDETLIFVNTYCGKRLR